MTCKGDDCLPIVRRNGNFPLVLVAGFLGAGKTTLLRSLIPQIIAAGRKPVVIINDFQNANIDAERLRELQIAVTPVSGSCVCCSSRDELLDLLEKIHLQDNALVLLEANGTTDTASLIELLTLDRRALRYSYPVQICVIDAKRWGRRMFYDFLEKSQLQTASYVFISRQDQVKPARWQQVVDEVFQFNPHCRLITAEDFAKRIALEFLLNKASQMGDSISASRVGLAHLQGSEQHNNNEVTSYSDEKGQQTQKISKENRATNKSLQEVRHSHREPEGDEHAHEHGEHNHDSHHFASLEVLLPDAVNQQEIAEWLQKLPGSVFRVKGLAKLAPQGWHVFEMVEDLREILFHPVKGQPVVSPRAVLIGPRLCPDEIAQSLRSNWPKKKFAFV